MRAKIQFILRSADFVGVIMDFKRVTYFELFRPAETSARVSAPKLYVNGFWNLVTVIFGVPKKSKLAITLPFPEHLTAVLSI